VTGIWPIGFIAEPFAVCHTTLEGSKLLGFNNDSPAIETSAPESSRTKATTYFLREDTHTCILVAGSNTVALELLDSLACGNCPEESLYELS